VYADLKTLLIYITNSSPISYKYMTTELVNTNYMYKH